jgi:pyruvate ferredoxin oxidoreductase gamma subunit
LVDTTKLLEIRWHGRGGQGAVTSAELLARAAIAEGKYAQAFPSFGPERRGAPVLAFDRISPKTQIRVRAEITQPDVVVVLDPGLVKVVNVTSGLKDGGLIIINTKKGLEEAAADFDRKWAVAVVDATKIAQEVLGVNIVNTTMLGALLKATDIVKIESLHEPLQERFGRLAERNVSSMKRAFDETKVKEQAGAKV